MEHSILQSAYLGKYLSYELDMKMSNIEDTDRDRVLKSYEHILPSSHRISATREQRLATLVHSLLRPCLLSLGGQNHQVQAYHRLYICHATPCDISPPIRAVP